MIKSNYDYEVVEGRREGGREGGRTETYMFVGCFAPPLHTSAWLAVLASLTGERLEVSSQLAR